MRVLGIETSCDETAAAVVSDSVLSDVIWSQSIHESFGGVVPELASRAHVEKVVACTQEALGQAGIARPDAVAATAGPGLMGAVLVGLSFAKSLALGWGCPFVAVNHLEGHLLSPLLDAPELDFPFLSLVVSGGHTSLYLARGVGDYEVLGQTIDDAAGEAFDKVARMMGLGYPGGPIVDDLSTRGDGASISFPRPVPRSLGKSRVPNDARRPLDMSFSGLKTAVRTHLERSDLWVAEDVAASFQAAVVDVLADRISSAVRTTGVRKVAIGGGVAANSGLRARLLQMDLVPFLPPRSRCTDNGAMIAHCGRLRLQAGLSAGLEAPARASWAPGT
jgi:N6-L-threonylcarbamoyladenine synthase